MNKKVIMYQKIEEHGKKIAKIFGLKTTDYIKLSKRLFALENKAHRLTTQECNGEIEEAEAEKEYKTITRRLLNILEGNPNGVAVFINGDCRGYALKIKDTCVLSNNLDIFRDWGGYGILAPDFTE